MFKPGDKFIHFTKYGGVNRGIVAHINEVNNWDTTNLCVYSKVSIFTTNGVSLSLDGSNGQIFKVTEELTEDTAKSLNKTFRKAQDMKHRKNKRKIHMVNENKKA